MSIIEELNEHEKRQLEIMDFYNSGYTYEEIAKFMFMSVNTIKTIVNTWIKKLPTTSQDFIRLRHKIEKNAKKETIKAINYEATKEMGDKEIGRASCRERGKRSIVKIDVKKKIK